MEIDGLNVGLIKEDMQNILMEFMFKLYTLHNNCIYSNWKSKCDV